jgi:hypothetical protein
MNHSGWMEIPYWDGNNHVRKGESSNYLECLDSRWGVEKGDLGNGLGDCLLDWDFPLEGGGGSETSGVVVFSRNS